MARRSPFLMLSVAAALALGAPFVPVAGAATSDPVYFEHDDTLDGTPDERLSGYFSVAPFDPNDPPETQREAMIAFLESRDVNSNFTPPAASRTYEMFPFTVEPGTTNGSFTVALHWGTPAIDFDLYVYRRRPNGTLAPTPIAQSATGNDNEENATYTPATVDTPVEPGEYVIFVDNWCSSGDDATSVEVNEQFGGGACDPGDYPDEDDFTGKVTFAPLVLQNRLPQATIAGPDSGRTGDTLTFTATGTDGDGMITRYGFDLDGDGNFEYDSASNPSVSKAFDRPGAYNVGVRVHDDRGGVGYASKLVQISGPPATVLPGATKPVAAANLIETLSLRSPVFGGRRNRKLSVTYRLRDAGDVEIGLYRGGKRVRRLFKGARRAATTYRLSVSSRRLRRGTYSVRVVVRASGGRTRTARVSARRL